MFQLAYFRVHYLEKIWIVGLVCLAILFINKIHDKRKQKKFLSDRKAKELERTQMLMARKKEKENVV